MDTRPGREVDRVENYTVATSISIGAIFSLGFVNESSAN